MAERGSSAASIEALLARQRARLAETRKAVTPAGSAARLDEIARACRTAIRLLEGRPDAESLIARREPVPESTRRALDRLRRRGRPPEPHTPSTH